MNTRRIDNSDGSPVREPPMIDRRSRSLPRKTREARLNLTGRFDAMETIQQMDSLMRPVGYYDGIVLNFSDISHVKPSELYRFFTELAMTPQFNHMDIRIEGLRFSYSIAKS